MSRVTLRAFNETKSVEDLVDYLYFDVWEEYGSPLTTHMPFIYGGPWKIMAIVACYLYFVKVLGPRLMKDRKPMDLRNWIIAYDFFLVAVNVWLFATGLKVTNWGFDSFGCKQFTKDNVNISLTVAYVYFASKFIDLFDTVFFVLRKKSDHVSFLHLFHHAAMPFIGYMAVKFAPEPTTGFTLGANAFVHIVMYFYYGMAAMGPHMQPYLWWKRYITNLQLLQFAMITLHSLHIFFIPNCSYPMIIAYLELFHGVFFFALFYSFYRRTYKNNIKSE